MTSGKGSDLTNSGRICESVSLRNKIAAGQPQECVTLTVLESDFDVITSIVSFLWEYTTAARDVTF